MIIVYPLLVSKTITPHVLPGITKVLERFIIIYKMDEAISKVKLLDTDGKQKKIIRKGKNLFLKEIAPGPGYRPGQKKKAAKTGYQPVTQPQPQTAGDPKKNVPQQISADIGTFSFDAMSPEPTWTTVTGKGMKTTFLGIHVVPFKVKSDATLAYLMLSDLSIKNIHVKVVSYGRRFKKYLLQKWYNFKTHLPWILGGESKPGPGY